MEATVDAEDVQPGDRISQRGSYSWPVRSVARDDNGYIRIMDQTGGYHYFKPDARVILHTPEPAFVGEGYDR